MSTALVCIGDELLDGRTRDLNAHWLGSRLARLGQPLGMAQIVPDDFEAIALALQHATRVAKRVLVSGGLGPTADDRTREAAARFAGVPLVEDAKTLTELKQRYEVSGRPFVQTNHRQALFPERARVLGTEVGTAPGFRVESADWTVDFVPGVPREFRWFVKTHWLPLVAADGDPVSERRWRFFGLGESEVGQILEQCGLNDSSIHYTARFPEVHVYIRRVGVDAESAVERLDETVRDHLGQWLIGTGEDSLAERVGAALRARAWRISTAESCTGGQISQALTSVSGSSSYFDESLVTYSDAAKMERLGVCAEALERFGAVSAPVAIQMARAARRRSDADVALSVTGIAGPGGGTDSKPVGTVHLALATPDGLFHRHLQAPGRSRQAVRTWSTWAALTGVLWYLDGRLPTDWEQVGECVSS